MNLSFRSATQNDFDFLWKLHQDTMFKYVDAVYGWDDGVQLAYFTERYRPELLTLVESGGQRAGYYSLVERDLCLYLASMEVSPAFQSRGIGSACMARCMADARERGVPIELHVMKVNPAAQRLYARLGFEVVGELCKAGRAATHDHMRWIPG